jgi:segregation and condensation protein B
VLESLEEKGLIEETGRLDAPGTPRLFGTTMKFLQILGLRSLEDLPPPPQSASTSS